MPRKDTVICNRAKGIYLLLLSLLPLSRVYASEIEIRCHLPNEKEVMLTWGMNDWQYFENAKGTQRLAKPCGLRCRRML